MAAGGGGQEAKRAAADGPLREALQALVERHRGWGFWKYHHRLLKNGVLVNHKRLWRRYQARGLQLGKRRKKRRLPDRLKQPLQVPAGPKKRNEKLSVALPPKSIVVLELK